MKNHNWRLPTKEELLTLAKYNLFNHLSKIKISNSKREWTNMEDKTYTYRAWFVDFKTGYSYIGYKEDSHFVRCIRRTKKGNLKWGELSKRSMTWDEALKYAKNLK